MPHPDAYALYTHCVLKMNLSLPLNLYSFGLFFFSSKIITEKKMKNCTMILKAEKEKYIHLTGLTLNPVQHAFMYKLQLFINCLQ